MWMFPHVYVCIVMVSTMKFRQCGCVCCGVAWGWGFLLCMRPHLFHIWIRKSARENFVVSQSSTKGSWFGLRRVFMGGVVFALFSTPQHLPKSTLGE